VPICSALNIFLNTEPATLELFWSFESEFCTLAKAALVASTALSVNVASAMLFRDSVLVFDVSQPAV
jgi:hypothetical protein